MRVLTRYIGWELVAIHVLTGALFLCVNAIILRALTPDRWIAVLGLLPLAVFSWWGWYAETR